MPREAVVSGCCVITGRRGSAANAIDIPIPERFKLDETDPRFFEKLESAIVEVFDDFARVTVEFEPYRAAVLSEPDNQAKEFGKLMAVMEGRK
jgi:hypothetical protein